MNNPNLKKPTYSVIVLIYHRTQELVNMTKDCIVSVINSVDRDSTEIILVDNGSTIRTDYWEKNVDTYIRFDKNMGISHGWNTGLRASRGQFKVIIGDDTLVHKGWLEALREAMDMPNAGVVNPHLENLPAGKGIVENYKWPSGACFMLTQNTLDKVGYFDQDTFFPCNWEDWDYWLRVYKAGLKMYRNYHISIRHREGATLHANDLSAEFGQVKRAFIKKWGFDPTDVFCGETPIEKVLVR